MKSFKISRYSSKLSVEACIYIYGGRFNFCDIGIATKLVKYTPGIPRNYSVAVPSGMVHLDDDIFFNSHQTISFC